MASFIHHSSTGLIAPTIRMDVVATTPSLYPFPNQNGESTLIKKMSRRLLHLIAKRTITTIFPTPTLETIRRPNHVMHHKPSKEFAFGRNPKLPSRGIDGS
jgi:hypothetical protein